MTTPERYMILDTTGERRIVAQGMTTDAPNGLPAFSNPLKELMCIVMCACKKLFEDNRDAPDATSDDALPGPDALAAAPETESTATEEPRRMQQNCVATLFQTLDSACGYRSAVKAEVYYDMEGYRAGFRNMADRVPRLPQPLMSRSIPTRPLRWHWGVISHVGRRKNPMLSQPTFTRGGVSLRRPDIVVVRVPTMPPADSNIAMIYEMKFDERADQAQLQAYARIVDYDMNRVQVIEVKDCRCERRRERMREVSREELMAWAAAMTAALAAASASSGGRRPPTLEPANVNLGLALLGAVALGALAIAALPVEVPAGSAAFFVLMFGATAATR